MRRIPSGTAVSTLRMAVNESFQSKSGEKRRAHRCSWMWMSGTGRRRPAQQYLSKGSPVFVEGRLQMDEWTDKESGNKRSRLKVRADRVQFLSGGNRSGGSGGAMRDTAAPRPGRSRPMRNRWRSRAADENIPF